MRGRCEEGPDGMAENEGGVKEIACENWSSLLAALNATEEFLEAKDESLWFRGCRDCGYKLVPSLMRDTHGLSDEDHDQVEQDLFFEFQARAAELRHLGLTEWEYLFFGRHHGVPTRVLDWTDTFGVSLYFALEGWENLTEGRTREPTIWIVNPYKLNTETWNEREIILPRYLGLDADDEYWDFGELLAASGSWAWDGPVAIYPIQINERVRAQRAWFTIHGNDRRALEDQFPHSVVKLILKPECMPPALNFLQLAGFNRFSIYPDLDNLATWIRAERLQWAARRRVRNSGDEK
jgi:hypothetical protein